MTPSPTFCLFDAQNQLPLAWAIGWRERISAMGWPEMVFWLGMISLSFALLLLAGTRWGQVRPVSKCVVLSVLAHILFLCYAYGTSLSFNGVLTGDPIVRVKYLSIDEASGDESEPAGQAAEQVSETGTSSDTAPPETPPEAPPTAINEKPSVAPPQFADAKHADAATEIPSLLESQQQESPDTASTAASQSVREDAADAQTKPAEAVDDGSGSAITETASSEVQTAPASGATLPDQGRGATVAEAASDTANRTEPIPSSDLATAQTPQPRRLVDGEPLPDEYRLRSSPNRLEAARSFGATEESELAVASALVWLATQQQRDGRWDASDYGAGRETRTLGHDRRGAGADADTGISGLALLAFLGAGHTHVEGNFQETVQQGLDFLLRSQLPDGSLVGAAKDFEKMYCHGIALIAIGEAYAMTGDGRLLPGLKRGIQFTLSAQDRTSGGWRYRPGDRGDMSQCGWQVMALRSARLGGLAFPESAEKLAGSFVDSVMQGTNRGLAGYRPGERPSRTMTAEAMACRFLLDLPVRQAAVEEAEDFLLEELPGRSEPNLYYWYYATWFLFQTQGPAWETWNAELQRHLIARQFRDGLRAGSWDTNDVWGGYGGRIYTTAMATLCLEVYYRYLPLYDAAHATRQATRDAEGVRR